ncbi:MAG: alpha/beta hydrolase [Ilumatobacter sp.]|uniref:alpha/beta fold hydrolase n=1 Tax=Ilumatobacter sp. TaxID=1967498 RepID=UPI00260E213B|nr:alpha/beta hydrolase [Ilumatobacter sp.]MDJ0768909.1 alpha/beta hydrolase [Ilumatobacter sp.]
MTGDARASISPEPRRHALASGVELHTLRWSPNGDRAPGNDDHRPWVLTHGLASNARLWDGAARQLAALGHEVVTVDQRGHGLSSKPDDGYDVATCADDLALLIDELGFERPAVAGQSWGGNVVLELGHRQPDKVALVACVDGGIIDLRSAFPDWDDAARALAPPRLAGTPLADMEAWIARSAADWPDEGRRGTLANFEVREDGTIAPWLTFDRHLTVLRGLWEHRPSSRYPEMTVPVLLVPAETGDSNWTDSKREAIDGALDSLPRARAHWFRPAHHDVHAQHPALVADLLHRAATEPGFFEPTGRSDTTDTTDTRSTGGGS